MADTSLRASVTFVNLSRTATYVAPVSKIAYILLSSSARMDTSGLFRFTTETIGIADSSALAFSKPLGADESLAVSDSSTLGFQKSVDETVSFSDSVLVVLIFLRDVFDTTTLSDTSSLSFAPAKDETVTFGDSNSYAFNQFLTEAFAMNDLADIGDGISFEFIDFTANVVTITEAAVISTAPFATDSFALSDAGVGAMQDYCDITYFAEDYVGTRFTF
jgi:hypothetical protein